MARISLLLTGKSTQCGAMEKWKLMINFFVPKNLHLNICVMKHTHEVREKSSEISLPL